MPGLDSWVQQSWPALLAPMRQAIFAATGMSSSVGRVQHTLQGVRGAAGGVVKAHYQANDASKSVSETRVEHALNDSV